MLLVPVALLHVKTAKKRTLQRFLLKLKPEKPSVLSLPGDKIAISREETTKLKFITMALKLAKA